MAKIVLVHGVWVDGSSWAEVIKLLAHKGHQVHAAQLPLTSFAEDVAATNRVINHIGGPVVLVGHSYGGGVISEAGNNPLVQTLVYIAAFAPAPAQPLGALLSMNPPAAALQITPDPEGFVWVDAATFQDAISHDTHPGIANLAAAVQKPYAASLFETEIEDPAWQHKPSWYLITTEDRILNPKTQHTLAANIGAQTREVPTSHNALAANPQAVASIIEEAAA